MDVNKLLDDLEELIEFRRLPVIRAKRPFRKVFFLDVDDVLDYTHQIRVSLPQQIQKADQITREKDRILAEARESAESMKNEAAEQAELNIRKAQEDARVLVSNHEITRQAQQEGLRIIEQARKEAESIRHGADEYSREVLNRLSQRIEQHAQYVTSLQQTTQKAIEEATARVSVSS